MELAVRAIWNEWLERTLSARDGDTYAARRAARDRAYTLLRHEDMLATHHTMRLAQDADDMIDAA
jgi:hypothetical protein